MNLSAASSLAWASALALLLSYRHCCCDALSINAGSSARKLGWTSTSLHHHRRVVTTSLLAAGLDESENDESFLQDEFHQSNDPIISLMNIKYPSTSNNNGDVNIHFSGLNEFVQSVISSEQQRTTNFNKVLCATMMSMAIGMQPLLPACANDNTITNEALNYYEQGVTTTTSSITNTDAIIQSTSILASTSTDLSVKIDDTIGTKTTSQSAPSKLSMGVKIEYDPEEIEMKIQAEKEQLERMAQAEQQQQLLLKEKEAKEQKMVEEKAAVAAAEVAKATTSTATSTSTATTKSAEEQTKQIPPLTPPPTPVQTVENTQQLPPPPPPKSNTEKEELLKMLRDTSTTSSSKTKQVLPALSPIADNKAIKNDLIKMVEEADEQQLQLVKLLGVGAVGVGLINSVTSKKGDGTGDDIVSKDDGNDDTPIISSSPVVSSEEQTSTPLVVQKLKPIPPSTPPIPPGESTLNKVLGLLEDDLEELNKNLELLENDLYELNEDLDSLDQDDSSYTMPSKDVAPTITSVSTASYLDSLAGSNQLFDSNRSGIGFQSSYLGGLGGAAPLEFNYDGLAVVDDTSGYDDVDNSGYEASFGNENQIDEVEELPSTSPSASSSNAAYTQRQIFETKSGRRFSVDAGIVSDVNIDRRPGQSSTRLQMMFGTKQPRGRRSTRLYMSQPSDYGEEESLFPSTDALIEVLRQKKLEKDRRDAELRAQQQQAEQEALRARQEEEERILAEQQAKQLEEERLVAEEQRAREEAEQRAREEQERLLLEQKAKEEAALQMQLQMRMMAAEKKAEEEAMIEKFLMEQRAREEEAEKRRQQEEEAKRLAAEQRAREEAELKARREEEERAKEEARLKEEQAMRLKQEADELLQIEQSMTYINDALSQVDDRLDALNYYDNETDVDYRDIEDGIQYLNSAVSEIDSLLSEDDFDR